MSPEKTPIHTGHRARMRSRFFDTGLDGFQPHEILELLLFCAIPKRDVNPLAHTLLDEFGSVDAVLSAPAEALAKVPGVGSQTGEFFAALDQVCTAYREACSRSPQNLGNISHALTYVPDAARRSLKRGVTVLFTDRFGRPLCVHTFPGRPDDPSVIRSILSKTLSLHSHSTIIFCTGYRSAQPLTRLETEALQPLVGALAAIDVFTVDLILLSSDHLLSLRKENLLSGRPTELQGNLARWDHWLGPLAGAHSENRWLPLSIVSVGQT